MPIPEMEFGVRMFFRKDATFVLTVLVFTVFTAAAPELCFQNEVFAQSKSSGNKKAAAKQSVQTKPAVLKTQEFRTHKVQKGENLYRISLKYGTTMDEIVKINNLKNENSIFAGMTLKIPAAKNTSAKIQSSKDVSNAKTAAVKNPAKAVVTQTKPSGKKENFSWPIKNVISCQQDGFDGVKAIGLIIKGPAGSTVHCSAGGVVQRVGYMRGYGNFVLVKHPGDYFTIYSYLENIVVKQGQVIGKGTLLGRVDSDKHSVHFQIDHNGKSLNPLNHLPKRS